MAIGQRIIEAVVQHEAVKRNKEQEDNFVAGFNNPTACSQLVTKGVFGFWSQPYKRTLFVLKFKKFGAACEINKPAAFLRSFKQSAAKELCKTGNRRFFAQRTYTLNLWTHRISFVFWNEVPDPLAPKTQ